VTCKNNEVENKPRVNDVDGVQLNVPDEGATGDHLRSILLGSFAILIITPLVKPADQLVHGFSDRVNSVVSRNEDCGTHGEELDGGNVGDGDAEEALFSTDLSSLKSLPHLDSTKESRDSEGKSRSVEEGDKDDLPLSDLVTDDRATSILVREPILETNDGLRGFVNHISGRAQLNNKTHSSTQVKGRNWSYFA